MSLRLLHCTFTETSLGKGTHPESPDSGLVVDFVVVLKRVNKLNPRKDCGSGWISAELLQAGGGHMRVLRRVAGQPMYNAGQWTDVKVRECLTMCQRFSVASRRAGCATCHSLRGRNGAGFALHPLWMKVPRRVGANAAPTMSLCSSA